MIQFNSEQYCTVQQSIVFYSTAVYSIVQYSSVQYCTLPVCGQGRGNGRLGQGLANPEKKLFYLPKINWLKMFFFFFFAQEKFPSEFLLKIDVWK